MTPRERLQETERAVRPIRWLGAVFAVVQIGLLYEPPMGVSIPFARLPMAVVIAGLLVATNLVSRVVEKRGTVRELRVAGAAETVLDLAIVAWIVFAFSFDPESRLWPLYALPILEGALREHLRGALSLTVASTFAIGIQEAVVSGLPIAELVSSTTFRGGVLAIVAAATGTLAARLDHTRTAAERHAGRLAELALLSRDLTAERQRDKLLEILLDAARRLTDAPVGEVYLRTSDGDWVRRARSGLEADHTLIDEIVQSLSDLDTHESIVALDNTPASRRFPQVLVGRIGDTDPPEGLLLLASGPGGPQLTQDDEDLVRMLNAQAAVAMRNARLAEKEAGTVEELRALDDVKNEFMNVLAHEMRGPMTAMAGYATLLRRRWETLPEERRLSALDSIEEGTERLAKLVRDVQESMAADRRELPIHPQVLDVSDLVENAARAEVGTASDHRLELSMSPDIVPVVADADRVNQILSNLLSNAVKYSPDGGRIRVEATREGDLVRIAVVDDGFGIPQHMQSHLFQKFSRLPTPTSIGGTGLGLYLSRVLVEAMGGEIGVDSVEGRGSTFWFTLPVAGSDQVGRARDAAITDREDRSEARPSPRG